MSFSWRSAVGRDLLGIGSGSEESAGAGESFQCSVQLFLNVTEEVGFLSIESSPVFGSNIVWEADNPEIAEAVQERIDQQLPVHYRQKGLVANLSGHPFQYRDWEDLCGVDQLYSDIRHYVGPQKETWQSISCPVCQTVPVKWSSHCSFVLLTQPLRATFSDNPVGPSVKGSRLTVHRDLWKPVVAGAIQLRITVNGSPQFCSFLFVLDISGFYLVRVPCQCAADVHDIC